VYQLQQPLPLADGKIKEIPAAFSDVPSSLLTTMLVQASADVIRWLVAGGWWLCSIGSGRRPLP